MTVTFIGTIDPLALPQGPQGIPGTPGGVGLQGPPGIPGKDGISPVIDMTALAAAVAAILAGTPVVVPPPVVTPPSGPVPTVSLVNQGGPNSAAQNGLSLTNSQTITWTPVKGADSYIVYRNGVALAKGLTALTYTDSAATNSNDALPNNFSGVHFNGPRTIYKYSVSAVTGGVEGPQSVGMTFVQYANGVDYFGQTDFKNNLAINYASTAVPHAGSTAVASFTATAGAQYTQSQPAAGAPSVPLWSFEAGAFKDGYYCIDVYPTKANQIFQLNVISRLPQGDMYNNAQVQLGSAPAYGPSPMVANQWNSYKVPMSALGMGVATFKGYISGTQLTVTDYAAGQMVLQPTSWVSAAGMTTDYILGPGPSGGTGTGKGGTGTYTMGTSQTVGSASAPVTFTAQRTNVYKLSFTDMVYGSQGNTWYIDNEKWTG